MEKMKIGIHSSKNSFSDRWISYCEEQGIAYKIVDCYQNDIISQLSDCDALMWHFHHASPKDVLFAKQLLYSVKASGKHVFPDFETVWHFDDKVGQKYLLEAIGAPLVPSYVFYTKKEALKWTEQTTFPKVFKLRGGAGSSNVRLVHTKQKAKSLIFQAFGEGFKHDSLVSLSDVWKRYKKGKASILDVVKSIIRQFQSTPFAKVNGKERGYIYFQDFIPNNNFDIRIIVIDKKAFAIKRLVREHDFRASGSGNIVYEKEHFDNEAVLIAFSTAEILNSQCVAFDFVYSNNKPLIIEISYGFNVPVYDPCLGYWDNLMCWYEGAFNPYGWMVDLIVKGGLK